MNFLLVLFPNNLGNVNAEDVTVDIEVDRHFIFSVKTIKVTHCHCL